jgi:hypothetical protein
MKTPNRYLLKLTLSERYSPLQKAITFAVSYGYRELSSIRALFYPFSREVIAIAIQPLIRDGILSLLKAERCVELTQGMTNLYISVSTINNDSKFLSTEFSNKIDEQGMYELDKKFLESMLTDSESELDARKLLLIIEVRG